MKMNRLKPVDRNIKKRRYLFLFYIYFSQNKILSTPFESCLHFNCENNPLPAENDHLDIVSIAFNSPLAIELQIKQLKKHFKGISYSYYVADNSTDAVEREKIEHICKEHNVGYFRIPKNKELDRKRNGSYSHGAALNWAYYRFLKPRNAKYFGVLDHDIFPTKDLDFKEKIAFNCYYGRLRIDASGFYYLWPGISFWESSAISELKVNFLPCKIDDIYLDTGGSFWPIFFEKIPYKEIQMPLFYRVPLNEIGYNNSNYVEFFDDCWFHAKYTGRKMDDVQLIEEIIKNSDDIRKNLPKKWVE